MKRDSYHHGDLKQALISAGIAILKNEGVSALTLRSAARAANVSHSAPYAHFADKQALLAAISTQGFRDLQVKMSSTQARYADSPRDLLIETGWTYVQFALAEPALFKLMFSGILEDEHSYPEFVEVVHQTFHRLVDVVEACRKASVLSAGSAQETAVAVWSLVHGFVSLYLERQFPGQVLESHELKRLFIDSVGLFTQRT